jgi:L-arabinose isomerase
MGNNFNIGLVGVGLDTYWEQFDGLKERLIGYQNKVSEKMVSMDVDVINVPMIDSQQKAHEAVKLLLDKKIDMLFIFISTYALSSTILPVVQQCKVPIVLLNIQPEAVIDFKYINGLGDRGKMTGEWLAFCQACSLPEFASVFNRAKIQFEIITGYLQDEDVWKEIDEWLSAIKVVKGMRENRLGILGHYYTGMLDVYTDVTLQSVTFGTYIEQVEMCELAHYYESATEDELQAKLNEFHEKFDVSPDCEEYELQRAARTSIALDKLVEAHRLGSLAYYYEGFPGNSYENLVTSVIAGNTLLTGRGIPVAGECEVKNVQAMKIMSLLGAGGSFSEPYTIDFSQDVVLWGHDGPAHFAISEKKVQLVPLPVYHGKPGKGLSIQMSVKLGAVTLLSVCEGKDGVFLLVAEGESVSGDTLQIGNTNSRYRFSCGAKEFIEKWSKAGPSHHCAIGVGHVADKIEKVGRLLGIPTVRVC